MDEANCDESIDKSRYKDGANMDVWIDLYFNLTDIKMTPMEPETLRHVFILASSFHFILVIKL